MANIRVYERPQDSVFSDAQWNTLFHIFDAIISPLTPEETLELKRAYKAFAVKSVDDAVIEAFAKEAASDCKEFVEDVQNIFNNDIPEEKIKELKTLLDILNTRIGALLFTGYSTPIAQLPRKDVEVILRGWATARTGTFKKIYKTFATLGKFGYQRASPIAHKAMQFPGYPFSDEADAALKASAEKASAEPTFKFEDIEALSSKSSKGSREAEPIELTTSILVVGSGSGGGVIASRLASDLPHHQVMVVDKGYWFEPHELPRTEREGLQRLFEKKALAQTEDGNFTVLAGSAWGGGSTINWSVSWQLPASVRQEWAEKYGLDFVQTSEFQECMDYVCEKMSVVNFLEKDHNVSNYATLRGSHLLGQSVQAVPQNIIDPENHAKVCGHYCTIGCRGSGHSDLPGGGGKQGTARTFLLDARDRGAKFIQGFEADKVLFDKNGQAYGVKGRWRKGQDSKEVVHVVIKASKVVVASGTLNTPALLLRSGVKNYNLGRNLHLHPAMCMNSVWPKEQRPWEGGILTAVNTDFDGNTGNGYGTRIEGMLMLPGIGMTAMQWGGALDYKRKLLTFNQMAGHVLVNRDQGSGRIWIDSKGDYHIDYVPSAQDRKSMLETLVGACKMLHAAGATEINLPILGAPTYVKQENATKEADSTAFKKFIKEVEYNGLPNPNTFGTAHQMGTARMGTSKLGVVDDKGKLYGKRGVYVADASLFPTASGVNPMVTTMALADWVGRALVSEITVSEGKSRL